MLDVVLSIFLDFNKKVIDEEGVGVPVLVSGVGHSLEVGGDNSTGFEVAELVEAGSGVGVRVEELSESGSEFGEVRVIKALVVFHVHVNDVVSIELEELADDFVFKKKISQPTIYYNEK